MIVVAILVTFLSLSALLTSQFGRFAGRQSGNNDLMAAADAGLEYAYAAWEAQMKNGVTTLPTVTLANMNSTSQPFNAAGINFTALSISYADQNGAATSTPISTVTSNVPNYPGWTGTTYNFLAKVSVTSTGHYGFSTSDTPTLTSYRLFQYTQVPLFQAAIFYENTLEIHPGASMTVTGLVHTNADIWARGFSTLQFKSNVSYVTSYNEIGNSAITKGWDGDNGGYIPGVGPFAGVPLVTWSDGLTTGSSTARATQLTQVGAIDPFAGVSTSSPNGLYSMIQVPTAAPNNTPGTAAYDATAYNHAAAVITINSSLPVSNPLRVVVTDDTGAPLDAADTTALKTAINNGTTTTIYDQREAQNVVVTNLDMTKLLTATVPTGSATPTALQTAFANKGTNAAGAAVAAGTIYIHDVSPVTSTEPAIRLINGRTLGENITIASDNGVYIQGDYNTGGTSASAVPSNASGATDTTSPNVATYTRYATAVMADAVTILSNNWSDSNSTASLSGRNAVATTVNTAILAGDVPSDLDGNVTASGGAHNFPRFLENWNNINFTLHGFAGRSLPQSGIHWSLADRQRLLLAEPDVEFRHRFREQPTARFCQRHPILPWALAAG